MVETAGEAARADAGGGEEGEDARGEGRGAGGGEGGAVEFGGEAVEAVGGG